MFFRAVALTMSGETKIDTRGGHELENYLILESLSFRRKIMLLFAVIVPRFAITAVLGYKGVSFLILTESKKDLILNTVALAFIIEVDELLFATFAPFRAKYVISRFEPLRTTPDKLLRLLGTRLSMESFFWLAVALTLVTLSYLSWFHEVLIMRDFAYEILCGGQTNFVFPTSLATGIVHATASRLVEEG